MHLHLTNRFRHRRVSEILPREISRAISEVAMECNYHDG